MEHEKQNILVEHFIKVQKVDHEDQNMKFKKQITKNYKKQNMECEEQNVKCKE